MIKSVSFRPKLEDIKELQKLREKPKGVSLVGLALGKKIPVTVEVDNVGLTSVLFNYVGQKNVDHKIFADL